MQIHRLLSLAVLAAAGSLALAQAKSVEPPLVANSKTALVDTNSGTVQGFIHPGISTYRGIPYAKAARFQPGKTPAPP